MKLICDSRLNTKNSVLLCNTLLHIEEVLVKISVWRLALGIKTTGLEIGTGLSDYWLGGWHWTLRLLAWSWHWTLRLLAWRLALDIKTTGLEAGTGH
jgi:hypothetical protein